MNLIEAIVAAKKFRAAVYYPRGFSIGGTSYLPGLFSVETMLEFIKDLHEDHLLSEHWGWGATNQPTVHEEKKAREFWVTETDYEGTKTLSVYDAKPMFAWQKGYVPTSITAFKVREVTNE